MSRLVDAYVYSIRNCGCFFLIFPIIACFAFCFGFQGMENYKALALLERDGVPVVGKVSGLREMDAGDMGQTDMRYFVTCRFRIGEAADLVERELRVSEGLWPSLHKGDAVTVRYSSSDPTAWDIPDGRSAARARIGMWVCFIAGAASAVFFVSSWVVDVCLNRRSPQPEPMGQTVGKADSPV